MTTMVRDVLLLVDESSERRQELRRIFEERFHILEAGNEDQALFLMDSNSSVLAAVIVSRMLLVGKNDERFLLDESRKNWINEIPLFAVLDKDDAQGEYLAMELGADDVLFTPFYPELMERRVMTVLELYETKRSLSRQVEEQRELLQHSSEVAVDALISVIESRSLESAQHILRIRRFTQLLLEKVAENCPEYQLNESLIRTISSAASLHDIGKIAIPDAILNKPGRLTPEEFEVMKGHTTAGCDILRHLNGLGNEDYLRYAYNICRYHHERWDGSGYPEKLKGDEIPICAQVVAIADVYDALTTERVYKAAYAPSDAANMILRGDCGVFSPRLLECFKLVVNEFAELASKYADGYSPASDAITVPLDKPKEAENSALNQLLAKYEVLLHYLDETVAEVDMDKDLYHVSYNPNPDLMLLHDANNLDEAMSALAENVVHPDDRSMLTEQYRAYLDKFFESGLRKRVRRYRLRNLSGEYNYYDVTTLRIDSGDGSRKALAIWRQEARLQIQQEAIHQQIENMIRHSGMIGIPLSCCHDRWLTLDGLSDNFCRLIGMTTDEVKSKGARLMDLILFTERETVLSQLKKQLDQGNQAELEIPLYHKKGQLVWVIWKVILTQGSDGIDRLYGVLLDISRARLHDEEQRRLMKYHRLIFEQSGDILMEWELLTNRLTLQQRGNGTEFPLHLVGNPQNGTISSEQFHPDDMLKVQQEFASLNGEKRFTEFTVRVANEQGRYVWLRFRAASILSEEGKMVKIIAMLLNVDHEMHISEGIKDSLEQDTLTRLRNKEAARAQIEKSLNWNANGLSAMVIIDLDNFKQINDRYGHLYGDTLLIRVADEIRSLFRSTDVIARIGGDEFLVYMPNIPHRNLVERRSQTLIEAIHGIQQEHAQDLPLSCSVGIAFTPDHGTAYQELFQAADRALYQAKKQGKSCFIVYEPEMSGYLDSTTMINRKIDSDEVVGVINNDLALYVFNYLYESGDVEATIQSLLEIVGRQMDVSRVYIFENNEDDTTCSNTFEWCNDGVMPEKEHLQNVSYITDIPNYDKNFNEYGIFYVPEVEKLPQHLRDILEPQGIVSLLHCAIRDKGKFRGYVGFDDNESVRLWTKEQIETLTLLSKIISIFLLKYRMQNKAEE